MSIPESTPTPPVTSVPPTTPVLHKQSKKNPWRWIVAGIALVLILIWISPWVVMAFTTVSTDDAYVNGHVTFVAPRVPGQVVRVLVDDNNRVRKGDLLVQLDKEPYQVKVEIAQ